MTAASMCVISGLGNVGPLYDLSALKPDATSGHLVRASLRNDTDLNGVTGVIEKDYGWQLFTDYWSVKQLGLTAQANTFMSLVPLNNFQNNFKSIYEGVQLTSVSDVNSGKLCVIRTPEGQLDVLKEPSKEFGGIFMRIVPAIGLKPAGAIVTHCDSIQEARAVLKNLKRLPEIAGGYVFGSKKNQYLQDIWAKKGKGFFVVRLEQAEEVAISDAISRSQLFRKDDEEESGNEKVEVLGGESKNPSHLLVGGQVRDLNNV